MILENKIIYKKFSDDLSAVKPEGLSNTIHQFFNKEAKINVVAPFNEIIGGKELLEKLFNPMLYAFPTYIDAQIFFLVEFLMKKNG